MPKVHAFGGFMKRQHGSTTCSLFLVDAHEKGHPDGGRSRRLLVRPQDGGGERAHLEGGGPTGADRVGGAGRRSLLGPVVRPVEDLHSGPPYGRLRSE